MRSMVVTRVERRAYDAGRFAGREAGARQAVGAQAACRGGLDCRSGSRAEGGEHTLNMAAMLVTLEVSKLSGWLNADAPCQEPKEGI